MLCIVTGASRGIGRATAAHLARADHTVVCAARSREAVAAAASAITAEGGRADALSVDLSEPASIERLFAEAERRHGPLDALVNNAGIGDFGLVAGFSAERLDRLYAVNLRGTFLCCREAMRRMMPRNAGYIINVSSIVGLRGYANQAAYGATKHAIMGLTRALAAEAQPHGIRVSAVLPGGVDTALATAARPDLNPAELLAPDDVAQAIVYLLSLSERAAVDEIVIRRRNATPF